MGIALQIQPFVVGVGRSRKRGAAQEGTRVIDDAVRIAGEGPLKRHVLAAQPAP